MMIETGGIEYGKKPELKEDIEPIRPQFNEPIELIHETFDISFSVPIDASKEYWFQRDKEMLAEYLKKQEESNDEG